MSPTTFPARKWQLW